MIVLGLDTTGADCSACLVRDDQLLAARSERIGRGHAERLAPMVRDVLDEAGLTASQIDRLAVCTGPGSFTGLRVALSFAKGFALPRTLPIIGVNALYVAALSKSEGRQTLYQDIKRNQLMFSHFENGQALGGPIPEIGSFDEMATASTDLGAEIVEVTHVDIVRLAQAARALTPADYPADPLYARPPDAKLPGGVSLPA
jgi:tRNA threonylcarbamoyl adenosine modification protein YeaZ